MALRKLLVNVGLALGKAAAKYDPTGIAGALLERYSKAREKAELRAELEELMKARFDEFKDEVKGAMAELHPALAEDNRAEVEAYLFQFQASARQAARGLGDPSATTVPATVAVDDAEQLAAFLPQRRPHFVVGATVPGLPSWKLVEPLGSGGFGEVWKARHEDDGTFAAFKFFLDPTARSRFSAAEARVLKEIHQNAPTDGVVQLLQAEARQDPPWLQFEYVSGGDLSALLESWKNLPDAERVRQAGRAIRTLARTAGHFHALGVVHRDLKPSNILLRASPGGAKLVVADFGISKLIPAGRGTAPTPANSALATIRAYTAAYASPQQKKFLPADRRDDVYALAVLWYQLLRSDLSLERPSGDGWKRALAKLGVSKADVALLNRCWDDEPGERPKDGNELAALLAPAQAVPRSIQRDDSRRAADQRDRGSGDRPRDKRPDAKEGRRPERKQQAGGFNTATALAILLGLVFSCFGGIGVGVHYFMNRSNNSSDSKNNKVTFANYEKIRQGMTKREVESILGAGRLATREELVSISDGADGTEPPVPGRVGSNESNTEVRKQYWWPEIDAGRVYVWQNGSDAVFLSYKSDIMSQPCVEWKEFMSKDKAKSDHGAAQKHRADTLKGLQPKE